MRLRAVAVSLLLIVPAALPAQGRATPARASGEVRINYTEETLPNGLKVVYSEDHSTPVAAVLLWYNVGSKNEVPGRTGLAHLFEHLMLFNGSKNVIGGQFGVLEAAGARSGSDINGTTGQDRTNYFAQVPSNQIELALWVEADQMGTLLEALSLEKINNQREVVKNERRQSVDNRAYGMWVEKMLERIYPPAHPYHHPVVGSMADLSAASKEDVETFFRTYYAPNNAVLAVTGDIDVPGVKALVRKYFGPIPRGPAVPPVAPSELSPVVGTEQRLVINDSLAVAPAVFVGFRMPSARDPRGATTSLLGDIVAGGKSSRLYESLVRTQKAASVFSGNFGLVEGADVLYVGAVGRPGDNADSLEKALLEEIAKISGTVSRGELDIARANERFAFVNGLQTTGGFGGRADRLAEAWTLFHDVNHVNRVLPALDRVSAADVNALTRERLIPANRVTLVFVPVKKTAPPASPRNN